MSLDDLARGLAEGNVSRRRALGMLAGAAAAAVVGVRGAQAQPGCRRAGHPCEGNQQCCPGLDCRVTGPGAARRCAPPPPPQKKCFNKCKSDANCAKGCKCVETKHGKKCKPVCFGPCSDKDPCPKGCKCVKTKFGKKCRPDSI